MVDLRNELESIGLQAAPAGIYAHYFIRELVSSWASFSGESKRQESGIYLFVLPVTVCMYICMCIQYGYDVYATTSGKLSLSLCCTVYATTCYNR